MVSFDMEDVTMEGVVNIQVENLKYSRFKDTEVLSRYLRKFGRVLHSKTAHHMGTVRGN